jgi:poly-gamma-glutamate capsule biosynthesis protein CapA/YwtB (metallophosphatase superfamily)
VRLDGRFFAWIAVVALLSCSSSESEAPPGPVHHIGFVGDMLLGRTLNATIHDAGERARMLDAIAPLLRGFDVMIGNAEGVIAMGGAYTDKGEDRPYAYRAHPKILEVLVGAGFDVLTVGNNHSGDYGPLALREMLDRLLRAGIDYAGGGYGPDDAARPAYRKVGDTVVAVVGADLTGTCMFGAARGRAGSRCWNGSEARHRDRIVAGLSKTLREARKRAQVVVLSPHWGFNNRDEKDPAVRELGTQLIRAGYDAILGHSAHRFQGIELVDGKPIVWDAGNFLVDFGGGGPPHESFVFDLAFDRRGVTELRARPIALHRGRTVLATGAPAEAMLDRLTQLSKALGTEVKIDHGAGLVRCRPGGAEGPARATEPPKRRVPESVRLAPSDLFVDAVPADAVVPNVRFPNGVTLLGARLLLRELPVPKSANVVDLYFLADRALPPNLIIDVFGRRSEPEPASVSMSHTPGDELLPSEDWPVGRIVHDRSLVRLKMTPTGTVQFLVGLREGRRRLRPLGETPVIEEGLLPIGQATYRRGAPDLFEVLGRRGRAEGGAEARAGQR